MQPTPYPSIYSTNQPLLHSLHSTPPPTQSRRVTKCPRMVNLYLCLLCNLLIIDQCPELLSSGHKCARKLGPALHPLRKRNEDPSEKAAVAGRLLESMLLYINERLLLVLFYIVAAVLCLLKLSRYKGNDPLLVRAICIYPLSMTHPFTSVRFLVSQSSLNMFFILYKCSMSKK